MITLTYTEAGINERVRRAVDQSIEVIRRRVDATGTTEPSIQRQGADRVLVQVPGLQDPQQLKALLGETGNLEFRLLAQPGATDVDMLPMEDQGGQRVPVERRVIAEGGDLTDAQPAFDSQTNQPIVNFRFNIRGAQRFGQATTENLGRQLAIVLDNKVISAPTIQSPITGGAGQISGSFTVEQVEQPGGSAPLRRASGQAHHRRGAHRRPGPRTRLHRGRQDGHLRGRHLRDHLHVRHLWSLRPVREHRAPRPCGPDLRPHVGA